MRRRVETTVLEPRDRVAVRINRAASMLDCGRSKIYELLRQGRLKSVHYDNAQRVTVKSILELVESEE